MRMMVALTVALAVAAPAYAQGGFKRSGETLAVPPAGLTLPVALGSLVLVKTDEFTRKGEGMDNYAQWESPDKQVFATAYVYMPALADASLAAYATDRAVRQRFGSALTIAEQGSVAVDGKPGTAIRTVYAGGELAPGKPLVTGAAFVTVGRWTVKLRATGPADRRAEVIGALDGMIAGLRIAKKDTLATTRPLAFDAPCPGAETEAKVLPEKGIGADALLGAMMGGQIKSVTKPGEAVPVSFPGEGATRACVRGNIRLGQTSADLIQPVGDANPRTAMAVLSDSGTVLAIEKSAVDTGYAVRLYSVGQVDTMGQLDRQPGVTQLQGWLANPQNEVLRIRSRSRLDVNGKASIQIQRPPSEAPARPNG